MIEKKTNNGSSQCQHFRRGDPSTNGFKTTNDFVLGLGGEEVTEMGIDTTAGSSATTLAWQHTNVWAGGKLFGNYDKTGLHFYLDDPLSTRRAQTNYAGVLEQTCSSLPFGDALSCTGGDLQVPTEHHFTGKERDTESGNDYFEARYFSSATGRFISPDWSAKQEPVPYAKLDNPQTLNLYAYVGNNPLSSADIDGHQAPKQPNGEVSQVLNLIAQHREVINTVAKKYGVSPSAIAAIIFQEKLHGMAASLKDVPANVDASLQISSSANKRSIGLAEMQVGKAAHLLGKDVADPAQRKEVLAALRNDNSAIDMIGRNVSNMQNAVGRELTPVEAGMGHNAGLKGLNALLNGERGLTPVASRSVGWESGISAALQGNVPSGVDLSNMVINTY
jgi:RHS repeat-associated protein